MITCYYNVKKGSKPFFKVLFSQLEQKLADPEFNDLDVVVRIQQKIHAKNTLRITSNDLLTLFRQE